MPSTARIRCSSRARGWEPSSTCGTSCSSIAIGPLRTSSRQPSLLTVLRPDGRASPSAPSPRPLRPAFLFGSGHARPDGPRRGVQRRGCPRNGRIRRLDHADAERGPALRQADPHLLAHLWLVPRLRVERVLGPPPVRALRHPPRPDAIRIRHADVRTDSRPAGRPHAPAEYRGPGARSDGPDRHGPGVLHHPEHFLFLPRSIPSRRKGPVKTLVLGLLYRHGPGDLDQRTRRSPGPAPGRDPVPVAHWPLAGSCPGMPPPARDGGIPPDRRAVVRRDSPAPRRGLRRIGAWGHAHPLLLRHRRTRRDDPLLHPHPAPGLLPVERLPAGRAPPSSTRQPHYPSLPPRGGG